MAKEAATAQNGRRVKNSCLEVNLATISKEEVNRTHHQIPFQIITYLHIFVNTLSLKITLSYLGTEITTRGCYTETNITNDTKLSNLY